MAHTLYNTDLLDENKLLLLLNNARFVFDSQEELDEILNRLVGIGVELEIISDGTCELWIGFSRGYDLTVWSVKDAVTDYLENESKYHWEDSGYNTDWVNLKGCKKDGKKD